MNPDLCSKPIVGRDCRRFLDIASPDEGDAATGGKIIQRAWVQDICLTLTLLTQTLTLD